MSWVTFFFCCLEILSLTFNNLSVMYLGVVFFVSFQLGPLGSGCSLPPSDLGSFVPLFFSNKSFFSPTWLSSGNNFFPQKIYLRVICVLQVIHIFANHRVFWKTPKTCWYILCERAMGCLDCEIEWKLAECYIC